MKMFANLLLVCAALATLGGCASNPSGPSEEQLAQERQEREQREADLEQFRQESQERIRALRQDMDDRIEAGVATLEEYIDSGDPDVAKESVTHIIRLGEIAAIYNRADRYPEADESVEAHSTLAFGLAQAALDHGHLDAAEQVYRYIMSHYSGLAYQGIRDLARVGIDDVRAARRFR